MNNISIETQIKLMNARLDCVIDLLHLNGELTRCVMKKIGSEEAYTKSIALYEKHWQSILNDCSKEMGKILNDASKPNFQGLTAEEAQALNKAAQRSCEVDG